MKIIDGEICGDEQEKPDLGSIKVCNSEIFILFKDADKDNLSLLKGYGDGCLCYCTDKKYWLIKHNGEWVEV